jgi:hypothetical protein
MSTDITVTETSSGVDVTVTGGRARRTEEEIEDLAAALISGNGNITASYDDTNDALTIDTSALNQEEVEDTVASLLAAGSNLTLSYDDANDALSVELASDISATSANVDSAIIAQELGLPEYDDVSNAPQTQGRLVYATGSGTSTEGIYKHDGTSYNQVGRSGQWEEDGSGNIVPIDGETVGDGTTTADHQSVDTDELFNDEEPAIDRASPGWIAKSRYRIFDYLPEMDTASITTTVGSSGAVAGGDGKITIQAGGDVGSFTKAYDRNPVEVIRGYANSWHKFTVVFEGAPSDQISNLGRGRPDATDGYGFHLENGDLTGTVFASGAIQNQTGVLTSPTSTEFFDLRMIHDGSTVEFYVNQSNTSSADPDATLSSDPLTDSNAYDVVYLDCESTTSNNEFYRVFDMVGVVE